MAGRFIRRFSAAAALYAIAALAVAPLHDYVRVFDHMERVRDGDPVAAKRPWLALFYFVNEAGSGIRFLFTGNERYLAHYPSPSHLLAARTARARNGDWEMQMLVGRMHLFGEGAAAYDPQQGLEWLKMARDNAPAEYKTALSDLVGKAETLAGVNARLVKARAAKTAI